MGQMRQTKKQEVMLKLEQSLLNNENKTYRQLAKELNIKKDTVGKYIQEIIDKTPKKSLKETEFRLELMYDNLIKEAQIMLEEAVSFEETEKSIKLLLICHDKFIDFLERFGIKAKAIDNINIQGEIDNHVTIEVIETQRIIEQ
jgi:hypothetical protein